MVPFTSPASLIEEQHMNFVRTCTRSSPHLRARGLATGAALAAGSVPAQAHVKWFAPYIVEAPPQQIGRTLEDPWFWTGIALVLVFFLATRAIEKTPVGQGVLAVIDKLTNPLWQRLDDFMRFVIAAFFVAISLWTALIRRLSAITLFVIFNAAVYPFGRMDLVGHALIMAVIMAIAADPTPQIRFAIRRPLWSIPPALVAALLVFSGSYWGLHRLLYGPEGQPGAVAVQPRTHSPDPERPHRGEPAAVPGAHGHRRP